MNIKSRFKNPIFWVALIGIVFSAAGISFESLTDWSLLADALVSIVKNPVAIVAVIVAILGVFTDTSTKGLKDRKE